MSAVRAASPARVGMAAAPARLTCSPGAGPALSATRDPIRAQSVILAPPRGVRAFVSPKLGPTPLAGVRQAAVRRAPPRLIARATEGQRSSKGGSAVMERTKSAQKQAYKGPILDQGFGGGDIGKILHNGGGGGDDGGDDDDEWTGSWDDDGEGDDDGRWFRAAALRSLYDGATLRAVLAEWQRTLTDVPSALRQAAAAGICSSAALFRYATLDASPGLVRSLARSAPEPVARGLVGRLMADPAFVQKVLLEAGLAGALATFGEARRRGRDFWAELDAAAVDVLAAAALAAASAALVAPSAAARDPSATGASGALQAVPSTAADRALPGRAWTPEARAVAFFVRAIQLTVLGSAVGAARGAAHKGLGLAHDLARAAAGADASTSAPRAQPGAGASAGRAAAGASGRRARRAPKLRFNGPAAPRGTPSPSVQAAAAAGGAAAGLFGNTRLQILAGVDRYLFDHATSLRFCQLSSVAFRALGALAAEATRQQLEPRRLVDVPAAGAGRAARRPVAVDNGSALDPLRAVLDAAAARATGRPAPASTAELEFAGAPKNRKVSTVFEMSVARRR